MRVLWFTNGPMPAYYERRGAPNAVRGGWMWSLASRLRYDETITLGIAAQVSGGIKEKFSSEGISYYVMPHPKKLNHLVHFKKSIKDAIEIVEDFKPDIIHIHGTENYYGLIRKYISKETPIIINIQGILHTCKPNLLKGLELRDIKTLGVLNLAMLAYQNAIWERGVNRERDIIKENQYFIGGTEWDKSWVMGLNSNAKYYRLERIIRDSFFNAKWDIENLKRGCLVFTSFSLLKGSITLLKSVKMVKDRGFKIKLFIAGAKKERSIDNQLLKKRINELGIKEEVMFTGNLNEMELSKLLSESSIFVSPSFIDNESLSVIEAMLVGLPVITSYVGGVVTTVTDENTGEVNALMFPAGDEALLAEQIIKLLTNRELAIKLSTNARRLALERHNPERIVKRQIEIYKEVLNENKKIY